MKNIIGKVYEYLAISLMFSTIGAYLAYDYVDVLKQGWIWAFVIAEFAIIIALAFIDESKRLLRLFMLYVFTFINGITLSVIIEKFIGSGNGYIVFQALLLTGIIFAVLSIYARVTKTDFTNMGSVLFALLIILILSMISNIFIQSSLLGTIISTIGVLLFSVWIIYDTQNIVKGNITCPVNGAISLYLDMVNLFLFILDLLSSSDD